jgi:hypothetical protein
MKYIQCALGLMLITASAIASTKELCLQGICIGDDVETLPVKWKPIELSYSDRKFVETELEQRSVDDVYYDYNEHLVADKNVLLELLPFVIQKQQFDGNVLAALSKVKAICSSLTMTGELESESEHRLFVTFRAIADNGKRGKLRVVRIEKVFNVMAPHLRPKDASIYRALRKSLKEEFPSLQIVRDIDGRVNTEELANADVLLGFRFLSDASNPLVLRLIDAADIPLIEFDENISPLCKK